MSTDVYRRGDLVEVKGPAEILATLDARGALADLPFMPEMAALCGRRFRVDKRAEKICDTINYSGSRRLHDTVLLEDLRCDGSGHEGCQAQCRLFWKEAWLKRADAQTPMPTPPAAAELRALLDRVSSHLKRTVEEKGRSEEVWYCQNTELPQASEQLALTDPRAYLREYTSGNVSLGCFLKITARAIVEEPKRKMGLVPEIHLVGTRTEKVTDPPLDLQPGELVQVKSREEIAATLSPEGRNKGLWFDREMLAYCGGTYRVRHRVTRIIDEYRGGRMVVMKNPCITLEGVICTGDWSHRRWFCPRNITLYWREAWLRRVAPPA